MKLEDMIIRHEGFRDKPYLDSVGKLTIGIGRNLNDVGISKEEALYLLDNDIKQASKDLERSFPWFTSLTLARQDALVDMCFNIGINSLKGFTNTLNALQAGDYDKAADGILASKYARQVGKRAVEIATMIRTGKYVE
jgi:lysozyme